MRRHPLSSGNQPLAGFFVRLTLVGLALAFVSQDGIAQVLQPTTDATIPQKGDLRVNLSASFTSWYEQFALDSPIPGVNDGDREPEHVDFDGPVSGRLTPGMQPFAVDLNSDAAALGFDPVAASDLDMGNLTYGTIDNDVRRLPLALRHQLKKSL